MAVKNKLFPSIFLTGGTGFFGKSILSMLQRGFYKNCSFMILSRNPEYFLRENPQFKDIENIKFIRGDVRNFEFPQENFDYIFHAAAPAMHMPVGVERDIILRGTERVLQFAEKCNAQRILFVSSGAVYGPLSHDAEKLSETHLCNPVTEYGIAKFEAEQMCLKSGIDTVIARCFAFTGPYLNRKIHFAIGNFIQNCLDNKDIEIKGDGTPYRSYLYADDMVKWLFAVLLNGRAGEIYNIGSDHAVSIAELAEIVKNALSKNNKIFILGKAEPLKMPDRYIPDVSKIQKELNVTIETDLENAILKTVEHSV